MSFSLSRVAGTPSELLCAKSDADCVAASVVSNAESEVVDSHPLNMGDDDSSRLTRTNTVNSAVLCGVFGSPCLITAKATSPFEVVIKLSQPLVVESNSVSTTRCW